MAEISLFDYITDIGNNKQGLFCEGDSKNYNQFMINRGFGQHIDTVMLANEANKRSTLSDLMHNDLLFYSIEPKKRYGKWTKADTSDDDYIELIQQLYSVNRQVALDYIKMLDKEELKALKLNSNDKGGIRK